MSLSATRETVDQKAHRLVSEGRVTWAQGAAVIRGDHDSHMVRRTETGWTCTCPWGVNRPDSKPCSHILAAALTAPAQTPAPTAPPAPKPAPAQPQGPTQTLDRLLADLKASLAAANGQAKLPLSLERPSPLPPAQERLPRNVRRHQVFVRVTDPTELAALRQAANRTVRYIEEAGVHFAICEQAVLDVAMTMAQGVCR